MAQGIYLTFATDCCAKRVILFKKYTTDQNQKSKDYTFKDFILDCVHKMTDPAQTQDENSSMKMHHAF
jgi:hypothetical protein